MNEFIYKTLNTSQLSSAMRTDGSVAVKLTRKRAELTVKLIEFLNKLTGQDDKDYSFFQLLIFLLRYLGLLVRLVIFHRKLFRIFIFYFYNHLSYIIDDKEADLVVINFTQKQNRAESN